MQIHVGGWLHSEGFPLKFHFAILYTNFTMIVSIKWCSLAFFGAFCNYFMNEMKCWYPCISPFGWRPVALMFNCSSWLSSPLNPSSLKMLRRGQGLCYPSNLQEHFSFVKGRVAWTYLAIGFVNILICLFCQYHPKTTLPIKMLKDYWGSQYRWPPIACQDK